jgi:hypothetical protein
MCNSGGNQYGGGVNQRAAATITGLFKQTKIAASSHGMAT